MRTSRGFFPAYLSVFGFILFFQLNWAQFIGIYYDIFLRFCISFLLAAPALYLLLQIIHLLRVTFKRGNDIAMSLLPLYTFSFFHLEWFPYVSEHRLRWASYILFVAFGAAFIAAIVAAFRSPGRNCPVTAECRPVSSGASVVEVNRFFMAGLRGCYDRLLHALQHPVKVAGIVFYPVTWLLISMQLILLIKFSAFGFHHAFLLPVYTGVAVLTPVLLIQSIKSLSSGRHVRPFLGRLIIAVVVICYFLLTLFHVTEEAPFDFSLLRLNADLLLHGTSYAVLFDRLTLQSFVFTGFCAVFVIILFVVRPRKRQSFHPQPGSLPGGLLSLGAYLVLFFFPVQNRDQLRSLYGSACDYVKQESSLRAASSLLKNRFPYLQPAGTAVMPPDPSELPDIILVCLESSNGLLIGQKTAEGQEITPFFNSLIPRGVYIDHFYGHSVQTARGFFSILAGVPAGFRGKETAIPDLRFRGLPAILADLGYDTWFLKAYHDLGFDNTGEFMTKAGFKNVRSMTEDILTDEEKRMRWGMGLQDDYFYRKCFSLIDEDRRRTEASGGRHHPLFLTTFNVSNHMMFRDIPGNQKYLYPAAGPNDFPENYCNSMFVADSCLRELFSQIKKREWLKNPIIIVVGDHSFPSGKHSMKNERGAWEENFRTPFLLLWEGHLKPQRLSQHAYSQIDLMPTLFDLLNIAPAHHALGKSVLAPGRREPVLASQPYDGISLVAVDYPYKYVRKLNGGSQLLYNLSIDPDERSNLIGQQTLQQELVKLQNSITQLMANQLLIEQNRLWPPDTSR